MALLWNVPLWRSRLRSPLVALLCLAIFLVGSAFPLPSTTYAADPSDAYAQSSGQFFTQAADRPGAGFDVRDDVRDNAGETIHFWSEFNRLGGVETLGYPISRVYESEGFYYQLFQRALLQWRPESDRAVFANVLDELSDEGADAWLEGLGIPKSIGDDGSRGRFSTAVQTRLGWLVQPEIKDYFLEAGGFDTRVSIELFGLPTSLPQRFGPFVVQRFQRVALQVWLDSVPGMPAPGTVVPVLAGQLYRQHTQEHSAVADLRFVPQVVSGASSVAPAIVADSLRQPLALLAENPEGRGVAEALSSSGARLVVEKVPAIAIFSAGSMTVAVNPDYATGDPKAVATVLAHEGAHVADYLSGIDMNSSAGCYRTELVAFQTQARVWSAFYGPNGKPQPQSDLDVELNQILHQLTTNPDAFNRSVRTAYRSECG